MNARSLFQYKNDVNVARWYVRKALTGGADMADMRDATQYQNCRKQHLRMLHAQISLRNARRVARLPALLRQQAS